MIGAFSYKDIPSSNFDLVCKSVNRPLLPALKSNLTKLQSSSGVFDSGGVQYDLRNVTMKIQYVGKITGTDDTTAYYELRERARDIAAWLGGGNWGKLIITGEEDKYYWAKIEEDIDLDTVFEFGEADIPFVCEPFAYGLTDLTFSGSGSIVFNYPGTRHIDGRSPNNAKFTISFTGNNVGLSLNGRTLYYNGSGGTVTIDNVNMQVLGGQFANLSGDIDQFLSVIPGDNTLNVTGASNAVITVRPMYY